MQDSIITANKIIEMNNLEEALSQSCHSYPGGIKSLAADLSINLGTLYNKCNPNMPSHFLNIQEALEMMRNSQDYRVLDLLCNLTHHACVSPMKFKHISDMALFEAWTACDMEHGITTKIIRDALADNTINNTELQKIRSEMFIDFSHSLELLDRLRHFSGTVDQQSSSNENSLSNAIQTTIQQSKTHISNIARNIKIREIDLLKKTNPDNLNDNLTVQETIRLMQETDDYSILHALAKQLDHTVISIPLYEGINDMELLDAWSSWSDERSTTVSIIHSALLDNVIHHDELIHIEEEMFEDFHTELALLSRLELMLQ